MADAPAAGSGTFDHAEEEVVVLGWLVVGADAQLADRCAAGGHEVGEIVVSEVSAGAVVGFAVRRDDVAIGVDHLFIGVDDVVGRPLVEVFEHPSDRGRVDDVVVVAQCHDVAGGCVEAVVRGGGDPAVRRAFDEAPPGRVQTGPPSQHLADLGACRRIVDDDALDVGCCLRSDRVQLRTQRREGRVVDGEHDRCARRAVAARAPSGAAEARGDRRHRAGWYRSDPIRRIDPVTVAASIVVVTHRGAGDMVRACLASLDEAARSNEGPVVRTVVIDNSGRPAVPDTDYGPGVDDVVRVDNHGFGAAANAGIRMAQRASDAPVVVLNDDVEVSRGWLEPLLGALAAHDRVGAVQPVLLRHGTDRVNSVGVHLDEFGAGSDVGLDEPADSYDRPMPIEIFTAGAVLFRPEFIEETGGFDGRYFLYYEDVDLALRGTELGWTYRCEPDSVVFHHGGATTSGLGDDVVRYQERNRLWVAARFAPPATVVRAFWLSIRRLRHEPRTAHRRALVGGLVGLPGALVRRATARGRRRGAIVSADGG